MDSDGQAKILIAYGTRRGETAECASMVAQGLKIPSVLYDCADRAEPPLAGLAFVIVGTPLYSGRILPEVGEFCRRHEVELSGKKLAFFTCGVGLAQEDEHILRRSLPASLFSRRTLVSHFGGGTARTEKLSAAERIAFLSARRRQKSMAAVSGEAIKAFCHALNLRWFGAA